MFLSYRSRRSSSHAILHRAEHVLTSLFCSPRYFSSRCFTGRFTDTWRSSLQLRMFHRPSRFFRGSGLAVLQGANLALLLMTGMDAAGTGSAQNAPNHSNAYAGSKACESCHSGIYARFTKTAMGRSIQPADTSALARLSLPAHFTNSIVNREFDLFSKDGILYESEFAKTSDSTEIFRD